MISDNGLHGRMMFVRLWRNYNIPKIDELLYPLPASVVHLRGWIAGSMMGGGAVAGVGLMVNPKRGRDLRRHNPFSPAHLHWEDLMTYVITAVISFFLGILTLIYFLRHYAYFDFHSIEKDPKK